MSIKKYASALLLTMSVTSPSFAVFQQDLTMEDSDQELKYSSDRGLQCQDGSFAVKNITRSNNPQALPVKRLLSFDGGGSRGVFEATVAAVLEEIFNIDENKKTLGFGHLEWVALRDVFHAVAGTSTGSILAGGLFGHKSDGKPILERAIEGLQLYMRHGPEIFDKQKNIGKGLFGPAYDSKGLEGLLESFFQDAQLNHEKNKPMYIVAFNTTTNGAEIIRSCSTKTAYQTVIKQEPVTNGETLLRDASRASAAAPVYFSGMEMNNVVLLDGGLAANNPAQVIYDFEKQGKAAHIEIYSLGTGTEAFTKLSSKDSGAAKVISDLITQLFAAQGDAINQSLMSSLTMSISPLQYYARINPKLTKAQSGMENTSASYMKNAIETMFKIVRHGDVFKDMIAQLGLKMPKNEALEKIINTVNQKLYDFKGENYNSLSIHDKEYLKRCVANLDFDTYKYISLNNSGKFLDGDTLKVFQMDLSLDLSKGDKSKQDLLHKAIIIHEHVMQIKGLALEETDLPSQSANLDSFKKKIEEIARRDKNNPGDYIKALNTVGITAHNSPYIKEMTRIFITDLFRNVDLIITREDIENIINVVNDIVLSGNSGYVLTQTQVYGNTRLQVLKEGLKEYLNENFPPEAPNAPVAQNPDAPVAQNLDAPVAQNLDAPVAQNLDAPVAQNLDAPVAQNPDAQGTKGLFGWLSFYKS